LHGERAYSLVIGPAALRSNAAVATTSTAMANPTWPFGAGQPANGDSAQQRRSIADRQMGASYNPYRDVTVAAITTATAKQTSPSSGAGMVIGTSAKAPMDKILDVAWGMGSDVPVPADYDGDGKRHRCLAWRGRQLVHPA